MKTCTPWMLLCAVIFLSGCTKNQHSYTGSYTLASDRTIFLRIFSNDLAVTNANAFGEVALYKVNRTDSDIDLHIAECSSDRSAFPNFTVLIDAKGVILLTSTPVNGQGRLEFESVSFNSAKRSPSPAATQLRQ